MKEKMQALAKKYEEQLAGKGLQLNVKMRYFEASVTERTWNQSGGIWNLIDRYRDARSEKKYKNQPNRYHMVILRFCTTSASKIKEGWEKEYAFTLRKIERAHAGDKPIKTVQREEKLLYKIEKRICKILQKAESATPEEICRLTLADVLRYTHGAKYRYKKEIIGKNRDTWDLIYIGLYSVLAIFLVLGLWIVSKI